MKSTLIKDLYGEIERLKGGHCFIIRLSYFKGFFPQFQSNILLIPLCFNCFLPEVYAAREKNGVYIPKERYYQEESERKVGTFALSFLYSLPLTFQGMSSKNILSV